MYCSYLFCLVSFFVFPCNDFLERKCSGAERHWALKSELQVRTGTDVAHVSHPPSSHDRHYQLIIALLSSLRALRVLKTLYSSLGLTILPLTRICYGYVEPAKCLNIHFAAYEWWDLNKYQPLRADNFSSVKEG